LAMGDGWFSLGVVWWFMGGRGVFHHPCYVVRRCGVMWIRVLCFLDIALASFI